MTSELLPFGNSDSIIDESSASIEQPMKEDLWKALSIICSKLDGHSSV